MFLTLVMIKEDTFYLLTFMIYFNSKFADLHPHVGNLVERDHQFQDQQKFTLVT